MKRSKIRGTPRRIPAAFAATAIKTEWSASADLMHWMREIIEKEGLDLGLPDVETVGPDRKRPDLVIYETRRSDRILCPVETKLPYFDVFNESELKEPARKKANQRKAKYFAVTNYKQLVWYSTTKVNENAPEEEQIKGRYFLSEIEDLNEIKEARFSRPTIVALKQFLTDLYEVHTGKKAEPKHPVDEFLVWRLHEKIRVLAKYYSRIIYERYNEDPKFSKELRQWFGDQNWQFAGQPSDFDKAARQTAYLLVNKILFYDLLHAKRPGDLDPLEIPEGLTKGSMLAATLQGYFSQVLRIDYETIYDTDFIDSVAFPDSKEVVVEIKALTKLLRRYDLARLGYDIVGRIFERLIPEDERHNLGQYFTRSDVVDLILRFCLQHETDRVLDPACGAGTFLVRAYQHKKMMNQRLEHEKILETLWGNDIAKFPAHLATINLAIKDLGSNENYPRILKKDFFSLIVKQDGFDYENSLKGEIQTLSKVKREVKHPRYFEAIVGNPPYTRQEEISDISPGDKKYKETLIKRALLDVTERPLAHIGKRAGIHAYFFVHGFKFLRNGGRFGFIVSESWLDVDYGKGLQEFFLRNYKIIAIIASKVERWFEEADINTCIIILEKCDKKIERDANLCRFVYLKKPLTHFIPPAGDIWAQELSRLRAIDNLINTILSHDSLYENEELRIFPKSQKELWEEGVEIEEDGGQEHTGKEKKENYVGSKWGRYLRAPEIFFEILEKAKGKIVPFRQIANIKFGIKSGADDFFYLSKEDLLHLQLTPKYVKPIIVSLDETESIVIRVAKLPKSVFWANEEKSKLPKSILQYIRQGENRTFSKGKRSYIPAKTKTCSSRPLWYSLGERDPAPILHPLYMGDRFLILFNREGVLTNQNLHEVYPLYKEDDEAEVLCAIMNSIVFQLCHDLHGRNLTGAINVIGVEMGLLSQVPIIDTAQIPSSTRLDLLRAFRKLSVRPISHILDELGVFSGGNVSFNTAKPDRRELDKIIMRDILGLKEEEQLEVYKAVVDLVRSRIEKAQSVEKGKRYIEGVDVDALAGGVVKQVKGKKEK